VAERCLQPPPEALYNTGMYVVTGGAGFIGSNILYGLEKAGVGPLVVIDRMGDKDKWRNVAKRALFDIIHPDQAADFLESRANQVRAVIHMGAISATTETDVDKIIDNNFRLSMYLWNWCSANNTRLIYASSAATYGDGAQGFDDNCNAMELAKLRPMNPYGWSKHLFDRRVASMTTHGDLHPPQWVGLKFFNVYGPNEYHKSDMQSVIAKTYRRASNNEPAILFRSHNANYDDGEQLRDFIWVGDCVDIVLWFLDNAHVNGLFNCGTGKARSFADLARAVYSAANKQFSVQYVDTPLKIREKYQYFTEANISQLRDVNYNRPFTELEEGVTKYVQDFLNTSDPFL